MDLEALVRTNAAFYAALDGRDVPAMERLWAADHPVVCGHPGWPLIEGREQVLASFRAILENPGAPAVSCLECRAMQGGGLGCTVCLEQVGGQQFLATNVFVIEEGRWRLLHHHASPVPTGPIPAPKPDGWMN